MICATSFKNQKIAILGLGRSGLSAALALNAGGAEVFAWDDTAEQRVAATVRGIHLMNFAAVGLADIGCLVVSPGIPLTHPEPHPVVAMARAGGLEVIGDVELFVRTIERSRLIGITGTNGKSTVTSLLGHLMRASGVDVQIGGNLGEPVLNLERFQSSGTFVLELSSYQLDLINTASFDVAVWTNLTSDHLDRHGGIQGYIDAKKNIFKRQDSSCVAVVSVDDEVSRRVFHELIHRNIQKVMPISSKRPVEGGVYVKDGCLYDNLKDENIRVANLREFHGLPGQHNWQNAAAAFATARVCGLATSSIVCGLQSYPGLPHRLEEIACVKGIRFINDSKATNITAAVRALECYPAIYWIAGGRAKEFRLEPLMHVFSRIAHVFLIGESAEIMAETVNGHLSFTISKTLDAAVRQATKAALAADGEPPVVLFSPACASFDQFRNFEVRGDVFRSLVQTSELNTLELIRSSRARHKVGPNL